MPLNQLNANENVSVPIQNTDLSIDVLGRFACNTLQEALSSGTFDVIIVGSGMYGSYTAAKIRHYHPDLRILVLEAGPFLISEHVQNLSRIGYGIFSPVTGLPYISPASHPVSGHYYCVGGKSLGWGKWSPRLTESDINQWPRDMADYLRANYAHVEQEMGVTPREDFIYGELADALKLHIGNVLKNNSDFDDLSHSIAPIAAQSTAPSSGLYSFDAYSSVIALIDAIRGDINEAMGNDSNRKLMLVPRCRALGIRFNNNQAVAVQVTEGRAQRYREVPIAHDGKVMLALGSMETTRLALNSIPEGRTRNLAGRNLMAHLRSNFNIRVHRSELGLALNSSLQPAAFHIQGEIDGRRYHFQVLAAADNTYRVESILYRMVPDLDSLNAILAAQKTDWVTLRILTVGEILGFPDKAIHTPNTYWCDLSPFEHDNIAGLSIPKLYSHWVLRNEDNQFWNLMDGRAIDFSKSLVAKERNIEFQHANDDWRSSPIDIGGFRDSLGSTFHEAGTLWMGSSAETSITNTNGSFHEFPNLYVLDQSLFPTVGSANPVLTGLTICKKIAESIA